MTVPGEPEISDLLARAVPDALGAERMSGPSVMFRVVDRSGTSVAVKIVRTDVARRLTALHRDVGRTPGLLGLLRAGGSDHFGYLVYPFIETTLADRIEAGRLPAAEIAVVLAEVADGLARLHRLGHVHGDLKPANVLITDDGSGVLTDLDDALSIGSGVARLTPGFAAPELVAGAPLSPASDVYSLAVLVVTALTGSTLWLAGQAPPVETLSALGLSESAISALRRALDPDPARRTIGPTELIASLRSGAAGSVADSARTLPGRHAAADVQPDALPPSAPDDALVVAATRVFGYVDLRAVTVDRLPLQLQPEPERAEDAEPDRSVWRRPVMVVALAVAVLLVILGLVLALVL